ncbi:type 2 lanthipeptide synthetase LanM family protein [Streptomyces africanus]|uniref:type 2 lanthipeptide synthetase LanM family protein n=1 Tax=Streptomyces africanus TaxID=231024 RepID=UPI001180C401|nr:type 2 lanthipeptide synthetase LanM family protein [Streptomyces africanus]
MPQINPLELAVRAANLSERVQTMTRLGRPNTAAPSLDAFDTWRIDRLATRLADKFQQKSLHRSRPPQYDRAGLVHVLTSYRAFERGFAESTADDETRRFLTDIHSAWLPTYREALEGFEGNPAISYDGRLTTACEPFLRHLSRTLNAVRNEIGAACRVRLDRQLVDDFRNHLLDRFELCLAWAVEADANVHCQQSGIDRETATREEYLAYLEATFAQSSAYHAFYLKFPVLGRWLAHVTALLSAFGTEFLRNLAADAADISGSLFGQDIAEFRSVRLGNSDAHAGARTVARVAVRLADGSEGAFYYKPRCVRSEAAMQLLLGRLAADDVVGFRPRPVLAREGYGYEAEIPSGRNHVDSPAQVAAVYRELGGYLALFYVLGGGDLHFENIIVADGHAYVCDGETVLGVIPEGRGRAQGTMLDSVFKTGLLEWPRDADPAADAAGRMKVSGYAGGEGYSVPVPVPRINNRETGFRMSVRHTEGVRVDPGASNRIFLDGELVRPEDHSERIMEGFHRVYDWFTRHPDSAIGLLREAFRGAEARFINWGTQIYAQLLVSARHPKCLAEPLEVDLLANTIRTFPRTWDADGVLAEREVESLWRMDVPLFSAPADGTHLVHEHSVELASPLEVSPLDYAAERIRLLNERNRDQQSHYIAAGLATGEVASPAFRSTALDYATRIGKRLCDELADSRSAAPWTSYRLAGGELERVDIEADLYQGSAGVALFLAYLNELVPRPEFRNAAERALEHVLRAWDRTRLGAYSGLGGTVYLLTHLSHLWNDDRLLDEAALLADRVPRYVHGDRHFDVLHGAAGLIPVLLGLAGHRDGRMLDHAHRCARHLLEHANRDEDNNLSWPPFGGPEEAVADLTGFSHGAGGIGWALIQLGRHTGHEEYVDAGRRAFAYESRHFDPDEQDWYDLRTGRGGVARGDRHFANAWCNGAAGIGLSRISSWATLGKDDETLLRESYQALSATMRNFPRLKNHTLCHGTSGNAELFLRFALLRDEPAFRLEANVQVQSLWRNFDDAENGAAENSANFFPGLLIGISGFGMHFLRLAAPHRVPSVLLLDPPPART